MLVLQVASGIAYLHRNRCIHRDVKCANVLLDQLLHAKVADMGLAKAPLAVGSSGGTLGEHTVGAGTRRYMAPEVIASLSRRGQQTAPRTAMCGVETTGKQTAQYAMSCDVYSYSLLLWEIMHQRVVFEEFSGQEVAARVLAGELRPDLGGLHADVARFGPLIDCCGRIDAAERLAMDDCADVILCLLSQPDMKATAVLPHWVLARARFEGNETDRDSNSVEGSTDGSAPARHRAGESFDDHTAKMGNGTPYLIERPSTLERPSTRESERRETVPHPMAQMAGPSHQQGAAGASLDCTSTNASHDIPYRSAAEAVGSTEQAGSMGHFSA